MTVIQMNLLNVRQGVIVHQVNCMDRIGAGIAGQIIRKWPIVERMYHEAFRHAEPESLFGSWQPVSVAPGLTVINCFTQYGYGNPRRTGKTYTDVNKLIAALTEICEAYPYDQIWIPYGIGCGLGGANWNTLKYRLDDLPRLNVAKL